MVSSDAIQMSWRQCFHDIGGSEPPPCVWGNLAARYSEPHRAYHTLHHLDECLTWFGQVRRHARHPGDVAFALFYHDAIYDTHASDNEDRSAELAAAVLAEYVRGDANPRRVKSLIMATKHDAVPEDADAQLLVDIDLSILGSTPERFDEYERQIRKEYDWVAPDVFQTGRRRILLQFTRRTAIYSLPFFREHLETQARANLKRALAALL